ncbi:MAG: VCBS repeat-containing protein [Myxococcales bacterium]|nr:VCBS repeat-containing protein [Myxococcales bacterium]
MPHARWLVSLLSLVTCAADDDACERLGDLCHNPVVELRLDLARTRSFTADLDRDGARDLVTTSYGGALSIAWGLGDTRDYRLLPGGISDAAVADVTADDAPDLLVTALDPPSLHVFTDLGDRSFTAGPVVPLPGRPQAVWAGHLDDDGRLDIVVASALPRNCPDTGGARPWGSGVR